MANVGVDPPSLTTQIIRSCFSIDQLAEWGKDLQYKGFKQAVEKRIDVIMTMNLRSARPDELTPEQAKELRLFDKQYRDRKHGAYATSPWPHIHRQKNSG